MCVSRNHKKHIESLKAYSKYIDILKTTQKLFLFTR